MDATGVVYIADFGNNRIRRASSMEEVRLISDFNGDGKVDLDDFFLFAAVFGTKRGDPGYDPKFDLDNSGVIDFNDFFIFAAQFGEKETSSTELQEPALAGAKSSNPDDDDLTYFWAQISGPNHEGNSSRC